MTSLAYKAFRVGVAATLLFDALWFIRLAITQVLAKFFRPKLKSILQESISYSICTTKDIDFMGHCNNARYFRELDFSRFDYWFRSGLRSVIRDLGPSVYVVQHAR